MSPQAIGNILYALGKLGAKYWAFTDRMHIALELAIRASADEMVYKDAMQVIQGLSLVGFPWADITAPTRDRLSLAVYSRANYWSEEGPVHAVEIATILYALGKMKAQWEKLGAPLRAALFVGVTALCDFDAVDGTNPARNKEAFVRREKLKYGAARRAMAGVRGGSATSSSGSSISNRYRDLNSTIERDAVAAGGIKTQKSSFSQKGLNRIQSINSYEINRNSTNSRVQPMETLPGSVSAEAKVNVSNTAGNRHGTRDICQNEDAVASKILPVHIQSNISDIPPMETDAGQHTVDELMGERGIEKPLNDASMAMALANSIYGLSQIGVKVSTLPEAARECLWVGVLLFGDELTEQGLLMTVSAFARMGVVLGSIDITNSGNGIGIDLTAVDSIDEETSETSDNDDDEDVDGGGRASPAGDHAYSRINSTTTPRTAVMPPVVQAKIVECLISKMMIEKPQVSIDPQQEVPLHPHQDSTTELEEDYRGHTKGSPQVDMNMDTDMDTAIEWGNGSAASFRAGTSGNEVAYVLQQLGKMGLNANRDFDAVYRRVLFDYLSKELTVIEPLSRGHRGLDRDRLPVLQRLSLRLASMASIKIYWSSVPKHLQATILEQFTSCLPVAAVVTSHSAVDCVSTAAAAAGGGIAAADSAGVAATAAAATDCFDEKTNKQAAELCPRALLLNVMKSLTSLAVMGVPVSLLRTIRLSRPHDSAAAAGEKVAGYQHNQAAVSPQGERLTDYMSALLCEGLEDIDEQGAF